MAEENTNTGRRRRSLRFVGLVALIVLVTVLGLALLVNIFQRKQEARNPFFRVVELNDDTVDPSVWGKNFPLQYDDYLKTTDQVRTRYGGSEAEPRTPTQADPRSVVAQSRLEEDPRSIQARRSIEDQRSSRTFTDAQHQSCLPNVSQVVRR